MSAEEEIQEHVHHAHNSFDKTVAGTMAVVGALLALVSVAGQHYNTEELLLQERASDTWAQYQAKSIRRFVSRTTSDIIGQMKESVASAAMVKTYDQAEKQYIKDGEEIKHEAQALENESKTNARQSNRYHVSEVFLEVSIVFSSLSILLKRPMLFGAAVISAIVGAILAGSALFLK